MENIRYIKSNIVDIAKDATKYVAHCITSNYSMGAGVAKQLKITFPEMITELEQKFPNGDIPVGSIVLTNNIYNIVNKRKIHSKVTYANLLSGFCMLFDDMVSKGVSSVYIPKIGSGCDNLEWAWVYKVIMDALDCCNNSDISIYVCLIDDAELPIGAEYYSEVKTIMLDVSDIKDSSDDANIIVVNPDKFRTNNIDSEEKYSIVIGDGTFSGNYGIMLRLDDSVILSKIR